MRMKEKQINKKANALISSDRDMAGFEEHTKGIGMKLLLKMGYQGGGLGKNGQGILAPIQAEMKPKKAGLGYINTQGICKSDVHTRDESNRVQMTVNNEDLITVKPNWHKKCNAGKNTKNRKELKRAEDLISSADYCPVVQQMSILDMRGHQPKLLTNPLEISSAGISDIEDDNPDRLLEVKHNVKLIIDHVEMEIRTCGMKLKHQESTTAVLRQEKALLTSEASVQNKVISRLEDITMRIENARQRINANNISLDALTGIFGSIQTEYKEEYHMHKISSIALSFALPLILNRFQGWQPLLNPSHGIHVIRPWQKLLNGDGANSMDIFLDVAISESPYTQLLMESVFPALRFTTVHVWEPRSPELMLKFLETWDTLLPKTVRNEILLQLVLPKLSMAVNSWDPRKDIDFPIHFWIHPWLPYMQQELQPLCETIRIKLSESLRSWHPSNGYALQHLTPWKGVFGARSWEQLMVRSVIPKLMGALREFVINPSSQQLEPFAWAMAWANVMPVHRMADLLDALFFPKWHQALYNWLCSSPDFEQVSMWYIGWKSQFPAELLANQRIKHQLLIALNMMDQAAESLPIVQPNVNCCQVTKGSQLASNDFQQCNSAMEEAPLMTLKEVVETFAQENDVKFVPKVGQMDQGLQVYSFGSISICIDNANQRLLAKADKCISVSLQQLLEMHREFQAC